MFTSPVRPEQALLAGARRFFRGCARKTGELALSRSEDRDRARVLRERTYGSMVASEPARLRALAQKIDYGLFAETDQDKVQRLIEAMQSIVYRLQALEGAHAAGAGHAREAARPIADLGGKLGEVVEQVFQRWSRFETVDDVEARARLQKLGRELEAELDAAVSAEGSERFDDEVLADMYATLGCARGLIQAVGDTQGAITRIDWNELAEARF